MLFERSRPAARACFVIHRPCCCCCFCFSPQDLGATTQFTDDTLSRTATTATSDPTRSIPPPAMARLSLLLALLFSSCALIRAQKNDTDNGGVYEDYGGGGNNATTAPSPQQQQPNATAPSDNNNNNTTNATATATAFLPITLSNNNSWTDESGRLHEQNNYLLQNTASKPICDVTLRTPLTDSNSTHIHSSYNVDLRSACDESGDMHFALPFYLKKIWPGQVVSFGWILSVSRVTDESG
jgi:hypothetical protein